jgi:HEPN domain-containing protein
VKIEEHIEFWREGAEHDLETAESLFAAEKYDWCLFLDISCWKRR